MYSKLKSGRTFTILNTQWISFGNTTQKPLLETFIYPYIQIFKLPTYQIENRCYGKNVQFTKCFQIEHNNVTIMFVTSKL